MQKITPFLWFDDQAEEAMNYYVSVFKDSRITHITPGPDGKTIWVSAEIAGMVFYALNGGPYHPFTDAISLFVDCQNQSEVDELWNKLTSGGGEEGDCGWLKDKYGLSWQIIPKALSDYLAKDKSGKVMQAMLKMKKININKLKQAYE